MDTHERIQYERDTRKRDQRPHSDVRCADCGRRLVGNETVAHNWFRSRDRPRCSPCSDTVERRRSSDKWG